MRLFYDDFLNKDLPATIISGVSGALIGATTAVVAKGVLGAFKVSFLTGSYGSVALLGVKIFAPMIAGAAIGGALQLNLTEATEPSWWAIIGGSAVAVIPVVWLCSIPVTTAIALAALNIIVSALTIPYSGKSWTDPEAYMPSLLTDKIAALLGLEDK